MNPLLDNDFEGFLWTHYIATGVLFCRFCGVHDVKAHAMPHDSAVPSPRASSIAGLACIAAICAGFIVGWVLERNAGYLVAAAGALVLAPVWFEAPPKFNQSLKFAPRPLSKAGGVLTLVGYSLVLAGVVMRLMA